MAEGSSTTDIQRILAAIKSSEIVEDRVQLFNDFGRIELKNVSESDYASVLNCLVNFTCLDVTQCMLNRSIIQVALNLIDFNRSSCLPQILTLGVKANVWCGKHLKMSLFSTEESHEDKHSSVFFQLLVEILRFSASTFSTLLKFTDFGDKEFMDNVEIFILEVLNLTKDSISHAKKIQSFGSETLKVAHMVLDAVVKFCKARSEIVNWVGSDENGLRLDRPITVDHVICITKCAIEKLSQIGVFAATDGGNSVNILNVSWKGVVSLLQVGGGHFTEVNVANIVLTLLALITGPLKCAAQAWSSSLNEAISVTEAKRIFVPVKFYLINALKICLMYPHQAYTVYKEITLCVLKITCFWIFLSNENLLKCASVVITELLEETTLDLLLSLINSQKLKLEQKLEVLEWLFMNKGDSHSVLDCPTLSDCNLEWVNDIFCNSCESMNRAKILILGRVVLFINFLRYSHGLGGDVIIAITRKLNWFLDILVEEDVYSNILVLQFPLLYGSGKTAELVSQPIFTSLLQAFKTFMIVISSSTAWDEFESFLLENFLHPHFLCWEIVMECWCFMLRHAETQMANNILSKLCSLLKLLASSDSVFLLHSSFRKLARSICMLLTFGAQSMVNEVYMSLVSDGRSQLSPIFCLALFMEGFPLDLLTDELRNTSIQRIKSDYLDFVDNFDEASMVACSSGLFGIPVFILSASLPSLPEGLSDIDARTLKFLVAISSNYKSTVDKVIKDRYLQLFSETLGIISYLEQLYALDDIERAIMETENIFLSAPPVFLNKCKPRLAQFLAGLVHTEISDSDDDAKSCAVWELYHLLLRERHWALIHLAITAFGYFASRTTCNKLWRFVPQDAALSYDIVSGVESNQETFMVEFGKFLKKEIALLTVAPSPEQHELLGRDGLVLKQMVQMISAIAEEKERCDNMEVDRENQSNKKRKLPDGISRGVELLKSGLKIIGDGLSQWQVNHFDTAEQHVKYLTQFSQLENAITHFEELTGSGEVCSSSMQNDSRG
ncbi:unnamed protein product [Sphenostylis stenocarpa]|uniref:Uncharacterized protein n=1 Tax=Sphenostylis stenocarpa TaxID=92480 RepID=A0AA86W195_9FABA|nr:unnamed protein product [Sphenostylis stenocarpa]